MQLSVVIPTLDEEETLARALASVPRTAEPIVSDGRSRDRTPCIARRQGARLVTGEPGRAAQMNRGARAATGDVLLFLHADCALPEDADEAIRKSLTHDRVVGGAFRLSIDSPRRSFRLLSSGSNFRARYLGLPYGDQAIFLLRSVFERIGGYPEIPIMEDVELVRRLKSQGRLVVLPQVVTTCPRHWEKLGPFSTTLVNWAALSLHFLGLPPERLAPLYRRLRGEPELARPSRDTAALPND